jgi:hypothetical protein
VKVRIRHLGKINDATFDLRPITLLVGENNTNKTWTAYSIYALLKALSRREVGKRVLPRVGTKRFSEKIKLLASQTARRISEAPESASVNFEFPREDILESIDKELRISIGERELATVLATPYELLDGASATLTIPRSDLTHGTEFFILSRGGDGSLYYGPAKRPPGSNFSFEPDNFTKIVEDLQMHSLTVTYGVREWRDWEQRIGALLLEFTLRILGNVIALPAERKAIVSLYRALDNEARNQLPLPLDDFIQNLKTAESMSRDLGDRAALVGSRLNLIYSKLEAILGGQVSFQRLPAGDRLIFSPLKNISLPIQAASSIVRSLTGFAIALQQLYFQRNVIVIDEPEMNAHPSAQLSIVEILGTLANLGNYVIATTHSPYVIDHFNNLLAAGALEPKAKKLAADRFTLKMEESFLTPDMVSAYELSSDGKVKELMDPTRNRIASTIFGNVSSVLENLYSDLLEMGQE